MTLTGIGALLLGFSLLITIINVAILFCYHCYFIVPLFKLMSYQSGVSSPPNLDNKVFTLPIESKKGPRQPLKGKELADLMDKLTNAV